MKWWNILKIEPKDNPLSDEFEPPEIPPINRREYTTLGNFDYSKYIPKSQAKVILSKFPIAKKLFEIRDGEFWKKILRIEGNYWIYDNSYFTLAFNTKFDESILKEHDLKSTSMDVDLFLDSILDFYLTIDPNYQKRNEALELYATSIFDFLLQRYKGKGKSKDVIEGSISDAIQILQSFEGKTKPIEVVIQETFDAIKEGDTEIDWENMSEYYDAETYYDYWYNQQDDEGAIGNFMNPEDYAESTAEEELRRRRNRG